MFYFSLLAFKKITVDYKTWLAKLINNNILECEYCKEGGGIRLNGIKKKNLCNTHAIMICVIEGNVCALNWLI